MQVARAEPEGSALLSTVEFLRALYGDADKGSLGLWTRQDKKSYWFTPGDLELIVNKAQSLSAQNKDCYFGVGLRREGLSARERGRVADVISIPGYWADVDVQHSDSAGRDYFATKEEALKWLNEDLPFKPSLVVDSGNGLHAYWLSDEPVEATAERAEKAAAWQAFLKQRCDHDLDSVADMTRVLRVPGTQNFKNPDNGTPVNVIISTGKRYPLSELDEYGIKGLRTAVTDISDVQINVDPRRQPPIAKLEALKENDRKFKQTWKRQRNDLKDQSPSGYCLSIANTASIAGWNQQEICDLLIYWRSTQPDAHQKPPRWYALTIKVAGEATGAERAIEALSTTEDPVEIIKFASDIMRVDIVKITRLDPPSANGFQSDSTFTAHIRGGDKIHIPGTRDIVMQTSFRILVAEQARRVMNRVSEKKWAVFAEKFINAAAKEEGLAEGTIFYEVQSHLNEFANRNIWADSILEAAEAKNKLWYDKESCVVYFHWGGFIKWLRLNFVKMSNQNLKHALNAIGSNRKEFSDVFNADGDRLTPALWSIPRDMIIKKVPHQ